MNPPEVIELPLSTLENMQMELNWRFDEMDKLVKELRAFIKETNKRLRTQTQETPQHVGLNHPLHDHPKRTWTTHRRNDRPDF